MDVLLVGSDSPVGIALQGAFAQWGRHRATPLTSAASRWRSERQAKKVARKGDPDTVVDLRIATLISAGEVPEEVDLERSHWLAKACERSGMRYIFLSSDRVFSGTATRSLRECDGADARDAVGVRLADIEERIEAASPAAIVLRTGPLFADSQANMLTRILNAMGSDRAATFDDHEVFCPVAALDAARVLAAILDQLGVGARASGIYHYCSGDRTTEYGFAEASLAAASQFVDCGDVVISPSAPGAEGPPAQRVLECSRLRDAFAIKQVPWRGFINVVVRQYIQRQQEANKA
jgi:dTDP-4-dehydrorhamnose reductase